MDNLIFLTCLAPLTFGASLGLSVRQYTRGWERNGSLDGIGIMVRSFCRAFDEELRIAEKEVTSLLYKEK